MQIIFKSLPAPEQARLRVDNGEGFSHRGLEVGHHLLGPIIRENLTQFLQNQLVQRVLSAGHDNGQDADGAVVVVAQEIEDLLKK